MVTLHLFGHVWNVHGWVAALVMFLIAFHDIILWPVMFLIGAATGKKVEKQRKYPKLKKDR